MNAVGKKVALAAVAQAAVLGAGKTATLRIANKKGVTVGATGSVSHVLTNQKIDNQNKAAAIAKMTKEGIKDTFKLTGAVAATAGGAAIVAGVSKGAQGKVASLVSGVGKLLDRISIDGNSLKGIVKDSCIGKSFLNATPAAKAAVLGGAAALAILAPIVSAVSASKSGYIEGQYENK